MEIQLQLILTAGIVPTKCGITLISNFHFGFILAQSHDQTANQETPSKVDDKGKIQKNFQNLFNAIAQNDAGKSEIHSGILNEEVMRERQTFDTMKEELEMALYRSTYKKRNFYNSRNIENQNISAVKRETNESSLSSNERVYNFPEIQDGDALQPTLDLLLSQQKYHKQLAILFEEMWEKNTKNPNVGLLSHSIGDSVMVAGELIDENIERIREQIKNGSASEDFKKEPLDDECSGSLLESWRFLLEYTSTNELRDYGLNVDEEVEDMQKILRLASRELEVYDQYLDKVYEEAYGTRVARPDRKGFLPPEY